MSKLRVGVIGLGMGRNHIKGFQRHEKADVVAIADVDEAKLKQVGEEYGVKKSFRSGEELIENASKLDLDIISVATPNKFHCGLSIASMQAGCHVLCEKPLAMNAGEGREMEKVSQETGCRLMVNFSFRFKDAAQALKRQVDAGRLGDIYYARTVWLRRRGMPGFGGWFGQKALSGGGPLIDLGVHRIDLALWLMGYPDPTYVLGSTYDHIAQEVARKEKKDFDVEDLAVAMVKFDNNATLVAEASWASNIEEKGLQEIRLMGTEGGLLYNNTHKKDAELYYESEGDHYNACLNAVGSPAPSAMEHFVDCILNDKPHIASVREGVVVMELLDAIYESAEKGEPVKLQ